MYSEDMADACNKPDGTRRKLMDVSRLHSLGWHAKTTLQNGMATAYEDFRDGLY
jgi:GDP-L-fucose synthase